jgi:hypothetical protein
MIKRVGAVVAIAGALGGATAAQANAMGALNGPACSARLIAAEVGTTGSCSFTTGTGYTSINVVTDGTLTVTLSCNDRGYVRTRSNTFTESGEWSTHAIGQCQMTLTSGFPGTTAVATATPSINPNPVP